MKQTLILKALPEPINVIIATSDFTTSPSPTDKTIADPLEAIRVRAETVSTLLKEIMEHGATSHWGINE